MKRIIDLMLSGFLLLILSPVLLIIIFAIKLDSDGPAIYWSNRVGLLGELFTMPKFRTMKIGTPPVATHLLINPEERLTGIGGFLRKYSFDELPQLWSILMGDMSFVGPRPALFNQYDLISLRAQYGIDKLVPGLTGWAQVNGRDELSIEEKVRYELHYLKTRSLFFDMKIVIKTILRALDSSGVSH